MPVATDEIEEKKTDNKLFVYGIFLSEDMRDSMGLSNPIYATVRNYVTVSYGDGYIVKACKVKGSSYCLTGLVVDVDPDIWYRLDRLEGGYDRVKVTTTEGQRAWMYVEREGR